MLPGLYDDGDEQYTVDQYGTDTTGSYGDNRYSVNLEMDALYSRYSSAAAYIDHVLSGYDNGAEHGEQSTYGNSLSGYSTFLDLSIPYIGSYKPKYGH